MPLVTALQTQIILKNSKTTLNKTYDMKLKIIEGLAKSSKITRTKTRFYDNNLDDNNYTYLSGFPRAGPGVELARRPPLAKSVRI